MIIGVPTEIKKEELRVAITSAGVSALVAHGHQVLIEKNAGVGSGIVDGQFKAAGAKILKDARALWEQADMILKVKEPLEAEYPLIREGQILFTYLHLAANLPLTEHLINSGAISIASLTMGPSRFWPL